MTIEYDDYEFNTQDVLWSIELIKSFIEYFNNNECMMLEKRVEKLYGYFCKLTNIINEPPHMPVPVSNNDYDYDKNSVFEGIEDDIYTALAYVKLYAEYINKDFTHDLVDMLGNLETQILELYGPLSI